MAKHEQHDALELDTRRAIYQYIKTCPGAHLRQVHRAVGLPFGQVLYHLNYLEKHELIVVKKDGKFNRYFVKHLIGRREKDVISVLRHEVPRRVCILLLFQPRMTHKDILAFVDVSPSTLSFHLNKMVEMGVLSRESVGRESFYALLDSQLTAKTLIMHRESFQSEVVDRFADVWITMHFGTRADAEGAEPAEPAKKDWRTLAVSVLGQIAPAAAAPPPATTATGAPAGASL